MSLEPKSAMQEVNTVPPWKSRFNLSVLHLPRNVYLLLFFTLGKGFQLTIASASQWLSGLHVELICANWWGLS
jgi:hypothetical protein